MRVNKHVTTCLTFLASMVVFVPLAEATRQTPDLRHVRCVLRITADAAVVPPNLTVIESLLRSDGVAGRAASAVLGAEFGEIPHVITVGLLSTSQDDRGQHEAFAPADPNVTEVAIRRGERTVMLSLAIDLQGIRRRMPGSKQDTPEVQSLEAAIDIAKQCIDACERALPRPSGGLDAGVRDMAWPPWGLLSDEEQTLSMRLAAKQNELAQVSRRIARIQDALIGQTRFDPEVHRLHMAAKRLKEADLRVQQLERQIAELQPCNVTILGGLN